METRRELTAIESTLAADVARLKAENARLVTDIDGLSATCAAQSDYEQKARECLAWRNRCERMTDENAALREACERTLNRLTAPHFSYQRRDAIIEDLTAAIAKARQT